MEPKTLGSYGAPKVDALPVSNPESQVAASEMNRYMEDLAQATRTVARAVVKFPTTTVAGAIAPASIFHRSVWGNGDAQKPTVVRGGSAGVYTITYDATFTDPLSHLETVAFFDGQATIRSLNPLDTNSARLVSLASNVAIVQVYDTSAAPPVAADDGSISGASIDVTVWLV